MREMAEELAMPAEVGRMIATSESFYRREGEDIHTGTQDGPTETRFVYVEATEDIDPNPDGRDA